MLKSSKVKPDDLVAFLTYAKVKKVEPNKLTVCDVERNTPFLVEGKNLIEDALSADQFSSTKKVSKTQAAEALVSAGNRPFSVTFVKTNGEIRRLRGYLMSTEPLLGRSKVKDLDVDKGSPLRQVDHRTIQELIVDNTKYVVK